MRGGENSPEMVYNGADYWISAANISQGHPLAAKILMARIFMIFPKPSCVISTGNVQL
jgi:hypothetical protein